MPTQTAAAAASAHVKCLTNLVHDEPVASSFHRDDWSLSSSLVIFLLLSHHVFLFTMHRTPPLIDWRLISVSSIFYATGLALISRIIRRCTPYADTGDVPIMNCVTHSCFEAFHTIVSIMMRPRQLLQLLLKSSDSLVNRPLSSPLSTCTMLKFFSSHKLCQLWLWALLSSLL